MLDRALQYKILKNLEAVYPDAVSVWPDEDEDSNVLPNVYYLREHGLIAIEIFESIGGAWSWGDAQITARGMDFLADDGGLSAVLGVLTVKLHGDTIRALIETKISETSAPEEEKLSLKKLLAKLPETALQVATTQLMTQGLNHLPDTAGWLRALAGY